MVCVETVNCLGGCWFLGDRDTNYKGVVYGGDLYSLTWNAEGELLSHEQPFILCSFYVQKCVQLLRVGA